MNTRATAASRPTLLLAAVAALALSMLYVIGTVNASSKVTICHANSGTKEFVAITIDEGASAFPHLDDNGSALNGHEDDFLLPFEGDAEDCRNADESVPPSVEGSVPGSVEESVPGSVEESVPGSVAESVPESAEGTVGAGTGTPEESTPDGALSLNGSNPLPTIAFSLVLLASLAGLAFANVKGARSRS